MTGILDLGAPIILIDNGAEFTSLNLINISALGLALIETGVCLKLR